MNQTISIRAPEEFGMKSEALCIPCVIRQCQRVAAMVSNDAELLIKVTKNALTRIPNLSLTEPPSLFTSRVLLSAYETLGVKDPFAVVKRQQTQLGKKVAEKLRSKIDKSADPLHSAIFYATLGNVIDSGPQENFDLQEVLNRTNFNHDDYKLFKEKLGSATTILYILDNAGEIYFDKLLVEKLLAWEIILAVKSGPILNDVTISEITEAELDRLAKIVKTGSRFLGINFAECSEEFQEAYTQADIVLAKGHANFESLVQGPRDAFFMLVAKCPVVANKLTELTGKKIKVGDTVFYYSPAEEEI
ncbi:MAG: ARMT1-like domain-containing protein [candidate division WOR-3 bacterium]